MITISTNVAVAAGSIATFAGFMAGYTIAWWQRGRYLAQALQEVAGPETATIIIHDLEARVRRSQA
jgi:ABC-type glycerol-3-phosphate transport system permease component